MAAGSGSSICGERRAHSSSDARLRKACRVPVLPANAGVTDLILSTRDNTVLLGQRALPAVMDATTGKVRATMNMLSD